MSVKQIEPTTPAPAAESKNEEPNLGVGIRLDPPVEYDGKVISFISTDFNKLTGGDLRQIAKEYKALHRPEAGTSYFMDTNYLLLVFARINKIEPVFFDKVSGSNYLALTEFYKLGVQESLMGN